MQHSALTTRDGHDIPLRGVEVLAEVLGTHASVRVRQRYENTASRPVEAVYTFPLPADATLTGFSMTCDGRRVEGVVKEREEAFRAYDDAVVAGHGAALLEQERTNVFTASVGNLLPREEVLVEVAYVQRVQVDEGALRWMIPTLVAPRYIPGAPTGDRIAHGEVAPTDRVPDADRITPPRVAEVPYGLRAEVVFDLGRDVTVSSPSHAVTQSREGRRVTVRFARDVVALDRDVVLTAQGVGEGVAATQGVAAHRRAGEEGYLALGLVPDLWSLGADAQRGVTVVFVVDVSGSMEGDSLREARAALALCLRHLRAGDRFNIVAFSSSYELFSKAPVAFSQATLSAADAWVARLAAGGGTELLEPLVAATKQCEGGVVVLLTDGEVGNEDEILRAVLRARGETRARVYSFGIGTNVSDALLRELSRETGAAVEFIHPGERIDDKVVAQFSRAVAPRITDVTVRFEGVEVAEAAPARAPDLVDGDAWSLFARYARGGSGHAVVSGRWGAGDFTLRVPLDLPDEAARPVVATLWAAERVRDFEDARVEGRRAEAMRDRIVKLAVAHGLATRFTSFVVVEHREGARRAAGMPDTKVIPVGLPAGWAMFDTDAPEEADEARERARGGGAAKGRVLKKAAKRPASKPTPAPRMTMSLGSAPKPASPSPARASSFAAMAPPPAPSADKAFDVGDAFDDAAAMPAPCVAAPCEEVAFAEFEREEAKPEPRKEASASLGDRFARQLASGLWDDPALGPDGDARRLAATLAVLRALLVDGVDTSHALYGAPLRKALEAVAAAAKGVAAHDPALAARCLAAAWLLATGARTKRAVEAAALACGAAEVTGRLGDSVALRAWLDANP